MVPFVAVVTLVVTVAVIVAVRALGLVVLRLLGPTPVVVAAVPATAVLVVLALG
jgi:hypothetical protein